jgi:hypothetical protein
MLMASCEFHMLISDINPKIREARASNLILRGAPHASSTRDFWDFVEK